MKLGAIQSCYIPWRGYFDFIDSVDVFVICDDLQYSQGFRNRNRLLHAQTVEWLTIPVSAHGRPNIEDVMIAKPHDQWTRRHRHRLRLALSPLPFCDEALGCWERGVVAETDRLSELNARLIHCVCEDLGIGTPIINSSCLNPVGRKTERIISLMKSAGASTYVTGPAGMDYIDVELFRQRGLGLEVKSYAYPAYVGPQRACSVELSILDMIAAKGLRACKAMLSSERPNQVVA
jgi:hypothetical protein